jgi:murein L,D-transpeptidase YcbB/YkuD
MPAAQAAPAKRARVSVGPARIKPPLTVTHAPEHPNVIPAPPEAQAAVDAAMSQVVRDLQTSELPQPSSTRAPADALRDPFTPPTAAKLSEAEPKFATSTSQLVAMQTAAAKKLLAFLIKTGRFGTLAHDPGPKDRPREIKEAQAALGVTQDGIVGPKTRAAAAAVGVAIPQRPRK